MKKADYKVRNVADKKRIRGIVEETKNMGESSIQEVIDFADANGLCKKDDHFNDFIKKNPYIFYRVGKVEFQEFQNLYRYLEGFTPFSTQHKIKGAEYSNVLVILDNGKWTSYDYGTLFGTGSTAESVITRTRKLFYVCCTRAKDNLVVYYHNPDSKIIKAAEKMFGINNVQMLTFK